MKKTTFLIAIFIAFYSYTYAQYTLIPDANFEQALIDDGIDTEGTLDGQILTIDANSAGSLDIAGDGVTLGIQDLTGIDAFINITDLNVSYNINLATGMNLTSNTLLTSISATGCAALTSVNVTGLVNVTNMLFANAGLLSLDVTTNLALENLNVRKCSISSLDLSLNTALTSINAKQNTLTFLDMRNGNNTNVTSFNADSNSGLQCIYVDDSSDPNLVPPVWIKDNNSTYLETEGDCNLLSLDQVNDSSFNMYPNPAKGSIYITAKTNNSVINIYNITGKVVLTKNLLKGDNLVDISRLASGIYLARFVSDNIVDTKKLIIK